MSFSIRSVAAGLVLVTASLLSGCGGGSGKPAPGMGCALNSECATGLICTFGLLSRPMREGHRLHPRDVREVDRGRRRRPTSTSASSPRRPTATTTVTAGSPLVCGRDEQCRNQCQSNVDCVTGQVCTTSGVCADQSQIVAGTNDVTLVTTGRDGGFDAFASGTAGTGAAGTGGAGGAATGTGGSVTGTGGAAARTPPAPAVRPAPQVRLGLAGSTGKGGATGTGGAAGASGGCGTGVRRRKQCVERRLPALRRLRSGLLRDRGLGDLQLEPDLRRRNLHLR